jgi:heme/copper-type cytochrome/quinol oxidase subunit 2
VGSAFFGWLTATGMAVLLIALLAAAGVAFGLATSQNVDQAVQESANATGTARTVGLVGAITLLVILFVAYFCGGYVAGRMARFNGIRQGLAVWLWGVVIAIIFAALAAVAGSQYNVYAQLNLPRIPVDEGDVTAVGLIAIAAAILTALIGALLGGLAGMRFHRKVDAEGLNSR